MDKELLHFSDWSMKDRYYLVPKELLKKIKEKIKMTPTRGDLIITFITTPPIERVSNVSTSMLEESFFLDWHNLLASCEEWDLD